MKKVLIMVVVAMMATGSVKAQDEVEMPMNEFAVAYGTGSNTDLIGTIAKGIFTGKQLDFWGPLSFEYFHRLNSNNRFGLGAVFVVAGCKWDDAKDAKTTFFTIMPAAKYNWVVKKHFSMYSKAALGITFRSESGKDSNSKDDGGGVNFNFHLTGIGLEYGSVVRIFGEAGFGEQGVFLAGLRLKF